MKLLDQMMAAYERWQWISLLRSYYLGSPEEKKARLQAIMELSVELAKVTAVTIQSSAFGKAAIEAIIEGDWKKASEYCGYLTFEEERGTSEDFYRRMNELYEPFRAILMAACAEARRRESGAPSVNN